MSRESGTDDDEGGDGEYVVKLRGLPWSASKEDILDFFAECRIHKGREGIHLVTNSEGRSSGEAFVELPPEEDITNFTKKDKETMGHRYIEVFKVKKAELDWYLRRNRPATSSSGSFRGTEDCEAFVRLRGLPFECTKEDIQDFFQGLEIVPNGIQLMVDTYGRSSGESYVQFSSTAEAERAFKTRDKQNIGHRYVEIFRVGPAELRSIQMLVSRPSGGRQSSFNNRYGGGSTPYDRGGRDRDSGPRFGSGGNSRPTRYHSKGFEEDSWNGYTGDGGNGNWNRGGNSAPPPLMPAFKRERGSGGSRGGGAGGSGPRSAHCVLLRGLPYKATEENIREFFQPLIPTEVHIIFESSGRPSGTAKVEFANNDDVTRAMAKHKERMDHRYIELFVHSV